jgi:hypothetical protein
MHRKVHEVHMRVIRPEHRHTLTTASILTLSLAKQGEHAEAQQSSARCTRCESACWDRSIKARC